MGQKIYAEAKRGTFSKLEKLQRENTNNIKLLSREKYTQPTFLFNLS